MLSSFFSCHLRRDNGGVGCFCGTVGYSGTDVSRTYTHACMRIYFDKELFLCAHLHILHFYKRLNTPCLLQKTRAVISRLLYPLPFAFRLSPLTSCQIAVQCIEWHIVYYFVALVWLERCFDRFW